ncbi:unnamed protein product [Paramecium primaurelia]|uniref:Transmembrane protein n=1 Tax=Paramecium primaurelia TaxID=5886 RepID=A0A8S1JP71_PARPR|nr:unnamed protein product [Paramecium primaurelia]
MINNSLLSEEIDLTKSSIRNDQEIVLMQSAMRYKTIKNNLQLVMILNFICLIGTTFAMAFYQWFLIVLPTNKTRIWLNLLYVYDKQVEKYMSYSTYENSEYNFCLYIKDLSQNDCLYELRLLEAIGIFCFCCIMVSLIFLSYDIIRLKHLLKAFEQQQKYQSRLKGVIVYSLIIVGQFVSLLVYFFTTILLTSLREIETHFGSSFWVNLFCCISLGIFACYYRKSKGRILRFQIMEKLINQELAEDSLNHLDSSEAHF